MRADIFQAVKVLKIIETNELRGMLSQLLLSIIPDYCGGMPELAKRP